jgi:hypothetical protein
MTDEAVAIARLDRALIAWLSKLFFLALVGFADLGAKIRLTV